MKFILVCAFLLVSSGFAFSQIITTVPQFPTENDSIVVYLDATQPGAEEILNYTGTLYTHTGVNTNLGLWQHVIGSWGNNATQPSLTRESPNHYKLVIGYPRKFYSVGTDEHITALDFVFRTSNGDKQTRPDIFVPLYNAGLNIVLNSPVLPQQFSNPLNAPVFAGQTDTVNLSFSMVQVNTKLSSFELFDNGNQILQSAQDSIVYPFIASGHKSGANIITAIATDTAGIKDTLSFAVMINPQIAQEPLPAGNDYGINYNNSTTVTLALYAPYKKFVYVIGDFNDWKVDSSYFMKEDEVTPDSVIWWITIPNLSPGREYTFQYLVDGNLRIADPFSEKISDPANDGYISASTYPGLIQYPAGKTNQIASVLQTAQAPYQWQDTTFKRPAKTNLVIYELLVRDFVSAHNYQTLIDTLGYFKRLGVNAIELMPIMEFEGNDSWGYNPDFDFAPDKYYGPKNDLKRFIDAAHENGFAVILDAPMNDIMGSSPLARLYWDSANNRPAANNPWLNPIATHDYNVGCDFNHDSPEVRYYMKRFTTNWLRNYHVDGFRFDLAKGYTQTITYTIYNGNVIYDDNKWAQYDQSRVDNLERIADNMWKVDSTSYAILELFSANNEEKVFADYGMMVWDNMSGAYEQASMGYSNPSWDLSGVSYKSWGWNVPGLIGYMESHDEERLMYKNLQYGNSSGSYNIKNLSTALDRIKLCEAFFYTIPGPKMLWQFQELGYDYSINYNGRVGDKPIRWDYYSNPDRLKLYKTTAALIKLKTDYPAFESSNYSTNLSGNIKTINITDSTMNVAIIGNFDVVMRYGILNFQSRGYWYDYFTGDSINVNGASIQFPLNPGEFHIYTSVKLPTPEQGIVTGIEDNPSAGVVKDYELSQNYPNPFNPATVINYQLPKGGMVKLKVYDVLGREVASLVNGEQQAGAHSVIFNGAKLASGTYFYRLQANGFVSVKKMIIMK